MHGLAAVAPNFGPRISQQHKAPTLRSVVADLAHVDYPELAEHIQGGYVVSQALTAVDDPGRICNVMWRGVQHWQCSS